MPPILEPLLLPAFQGGILLCSPLCQPSLGFQLLPAMAQKIPIKTTFFGRVCVFLPFLPSLFQSLTFSSHGSVFQSQAAEQAQGVTSTPPSKTPYPQFWGSPLLAHDTLHIFSS